MIVGMEMDTMFGQYHSILLIGIMYKVFPMLTMRVFHIFISFFLIGLSQ